jgi:hypothetical protein
MYDSFLFQQQEKLQINKFIYLFIYLLTYIPWIISGKLRLDIGIVNIHMDATTQCMYEYKYGIRQKLIIICML